MENYLSAEHLKQKHTFARKLIWMAPLLTLLLNILSPVWYQQNAYNWWYVFLYPGCLTLLCILVNQRDQAKLKYGAVYSLPVNLKKIWYAKIIICGIYAAIANIILMMGNILGGFIIRQFWGIPMTIHIAQALWGTACIILTSMWNIPLCLYAAKKRGGAAALAINMGMSFIGILGADTRFWIVCPYSWVSRSMIPILKILPNGNPADSASLSTPLLTVIMVILLSLILLLILSKTTAKSFSRQEVL